MPNSQVWDKEWTYRPNKFIKKPIKSHYWIYRDQNRIYVVRFSATCTTFNLHRRLYDLTTYLTQVIEKLLRKNRTVAHVNYLPFTVSKIYLRNQSEVTIAVGITHTKSCWTSSTHALHLSPCFLPPLTPKPYLTVQTPSQALPHNLQISLTRNTSHIPNNRDSALPQRPVS